MLRSSAITQGLQRSPNRAMLRAVGFDDEDFNKTNPGVWSMSMEDFKDKSGFTKWDQYKKDQPIGEDKIWPVPQKA